MQGFPCSSVGKESACNAGDPGLIPGSEISPGGGNGDTLQSSCLENPMGIGAWWATVHGVSRVGYDLVTKPPPQTTCKALPSVQRREKRQKVILFVELHNMLKLELRPLQSAHHLLLTAALQHGIMSTL